MGSIRMWFAAAAILALAVTASAQMGMGGMGMAGGFRGVWNPVVGAGGLYEIQNQRQGPGGGTSQMQIAIVGQETVNGKTGYWLEMTMDNPRGGGAMYSKFLYVLDGHNMQIVRMVIQPPGRSPIDMPVGGMMGNRQPQPQVADISREAQDLGSESVTVPAGTFTTEHYKTSDGADVWVSPKVSPWGLVKMTSTNSNMTLLKVVTDAKDMITGTPQTFDPSQMRPGGGPPQR
ncbi:MAG TPA: hypothetical protein VEH50_12465 [Methylomirabilota bacterium]|nr:hypothetical protein [Methylomirabilota bacterium]